MLGRAVHGVQNEWRWPSVDKLMLRASWHNDEVAGLDILVFARDGCLTLTGCEGKDLVDGVFLSSLQVSLEAGRRPENDVLNPAFPLRI